MSLEVALTTFLDCQSSSTFFGCSAAAVMCLAMKENTPSGAQAVEPVEYPKYHWLPRPKKHPLKNAFLLETEIFFGHPCHRAIGPHVYRPRFFVIEGIGQNVVLQA